MTQAIDINQIQGPVDVTWNGVSLTNVPVAKFPGVPSSISPTGPIGLQLRGIVGAELCPVAHQVIHAIAVRDAGNAKKSKSKNQNHAHGKK